MIKIIDEKNLIDISNANISESAREKISEIIKLLERGDKIQVRYKTKSSGNYIVIFVYDNELNRYYKKEEFQVV